MNVRKKFNFKKRPKSALLIAKQNFNLRYTYLKSPKNIYGIEWSKGNWLFNKYFLKNHK